MVPKYGDERHHYEFRVAGLLSPTAQGAFVGLDITEIPPQTVISGSLMDEAEMHGVLGLIQALGLHMVSVRELEP